MAVACRKDRKPKPGSSSNISSSGTSRKAQGKGAHRVCSLQKHDRREPWKLPDLPASPRQHSQTVFRQLHSVFDEPATAGLRPNHTGSSTGRPCRRARRVSQSGNRKAIPAFPELQKIPTGFQRPARHSGTRFLNILPGKATARASRTRFVEQPGNIAVFSEMPGMSD